MPRILSLIATIPQRRSSCERLLCQLTRQTRVPDGVLLRYDGYFQDGDSAETPACPLPVASFCATAKLSGPGQRWIFVLELLRLGVVDAEDTIICLDDDVFTLKAPRLIEALATEVEAHGAAAAMGMTADGKRAPPGKFSRGFLPYAAGCGLAMRAGLLVGLQELANEVRAAGGPDALGLGGDDDALVSAHLWRKDVKIKHAATGVINCAAGTQDVSQTKMRLARGEKLDGQKREIARITGWPWPG